MKRPRHIEYLCAALDALLAAIAIMLLAMLTGTRSETLLDPFVLFGLIIPFVTYAGVWGLFDARRQLSSRYRRVWSVSQGALITIFAWATYWIVGGVATAFACVDEEVAWADTSWSDRGLMGLGVLAISAFFGAQGAIGALVLSEVNSVVIALMPS